MRFAIRTSFLPILFYSFTGFAAPLVPISWSDLTGDDTWETTLNWLPPVVPDSVSVAVDLAIAAPNNLSSTRTVGALSLSSSARLNLVAWSSLSIRTGDASPAVLTNDGLIVVNTTEQESFTDIFLLGESRIEGSGVIELRGDHPGSFLDDGSLIVATGTATQGADHTIRGRGNVRLQYQATFVNNGTIAADSSGRTLEVRTDAPATLYNKGAIMAAAGGRLLLGSGIVDQTGGGTLESAGSGSVVQLGDLSGRGARIVGGELRTSDGGVIHAYAGALGGCTNFGQMEVVPDGYSRPEVDILSPGFTNNGAVVVNPGTSSGAGFRISSSVTLDGTGSIQFNGGSGAIVFNIESGALHHGNAHTMHGAGYLYFYPNTALINDGTIRGDQTTGSLVISRGGTHQNNGLLEAVDGGGMGISAPLDQSAGGVVWAHGAGSRISVYGDRDPRWAITGGSLRGENGGVIQLVGATLRGCTVYGDVTILDLNDVYNFAYYGTITLGNYAALRFNGGVIEGSGAIRLNGWTVSFASQVQNRSGQRTEGPGTIYVSSNSTFTNYGTIAPGSPIGTMNVTGDLKLARSSMLSFEIAGVSSFDQLRKIDALPLMLNGSLAVDLINGYEPSPSATFTIISTQAALQGQFQNVSSGGRLNTMSGAGSFQVDYIGNNVVLSNYSAFVPVPLIALTAVSRDATNDHFTLEAKGTPDTQFTVQACDDLANDFVSIATATTNENGALTWADTSAAATGPRRFYRLKYP
ncbi:MAG TPA: hypothetical protein VF511_03395 [Chthoniobacterales bacterium]